MNERTMSGHREEHIERPRQPRVFDHPKYYELAFSYRDVQAEVATIEKLLSRHADIPVSSVLELGCGSAPFVEALTQRGYSYTGLDLNGDMLAYARRKTAHANVDAEFQFGNMLDFRLDRPVDFVFLLLGSLFIHDTAELISHFDCVSRALRPGGLYLLEQCVASSPLTEGTFTWESSQDGIEVKTTFHVKSISRVDQTVEESLVLDVAHEGTARRLRQTWTRRLIYPQEFLMFIAHRADFEFIQWWKSWTLAEPLDNFETNTRSIALVKRV